MEGLMHIDKTLSRLVETITRVSGPVNANPAESSMENLDACLRTTEHLAQETKELKALTCTTLANLTHLEDQMKKLS